MRIRGPDIDESRGLSYEREDYFGFRWWPTPEIANGNDRLCPGPRPALLTVFLAVDTIDEAPELWS